MIHSRSKHGTRKVSPPGPSYMNEEQIATYLKDLRTNRPPRPNGSRPFPTKSISSSQKLRSDLPPRASSALSMNIDSENHRVSSLEPYQRSASALSHHRKHSTLSNGSVSTEQSLEEEPEQSYDLSRSLSPAASIRSTTGTYRVRGQRWMEREEARSLRQALEEMDFRDDEKRLHAAAQEEATQLVFSHQTSGFPKLNPHAPYLNPDLIATNQFRQHLKKGAYARSQSMNTSEERSQSVSQSRSHRSASDSSSNGGRTGRESPEFQRRVDPTGSNLSPKIVDVPEDNETISVTKNGTLTQKPRVNFALETDNSNSPRTVVQRKASPRTRIATSKFVASRHSTISQEIPS
ncbi:LIM domain-containing protein [Histoplasma capsulatum]|uniref:LIM domain-containing protein n=1 Tax=Ajellomyces capsulatus TaxID=5037 RepID=A0A8A1MD59_AJECA|nr:LIM domain-containing protein [Histoplasma capsulatum]